MYLGDNFMKKLVMTALAGACGWATGADLPLVPRPVEMKTGDGSFEITDDTAIRYDTSLQSEAQLFAGEIAAATGHEPRVVDEKLRIFLPSEITLDVDSSVDLPRSGYRLEVTAKGIKVTGKDAAGVFYGTRTLRQLLPAGKTTGAVKIPALEVKDYPRFAWRGMHLDVGRHFFPVEDIKTYIDWLAFHKINVFHWHLTEDQGWRIEIKKWPKLTEVGAWRESSPPYGNREGSDGKRYGGFYTQDQAREIVAYAKARHVNVVPEIDMPGHMTAAVTAYPELGNNDVPGYNPKVATKWGVFDDILAPTEKTFQFVDDVFTEICAIFPSAYIHMGGDEAPKTQWEKSPRVKELMKEKGLKDAHEVQSYFVKRVEKILESKGRKLIGWDEIREGGLSPKATVMSWRGEQGGIASAKEGHDVVMSANGFLYFDYYQEPAGEALAKGDEYEGIGGFLPIGKVYNYDPVPKSLSPEQAKHIIGVQGQAWTEYMKDFKKVEYHVFPRAAALAEVAWSPKEGKNFENFLVRLGGIIAQYDAAGLNHGPVWQAPKREARDGAQVSSSLSIYENHWPEYAFDGKEETFFWSDRSVKKGDVLTITFAKPLARDAKVSVKTGGEGKQAADKLANGTLDVLSNEKMWQVIGKFEGGTASGTAPAGTTALRISATADQAEWLVVPEITVD